MMTKASLDWNECLQLANNKADLANDLVSMLEKELPIFQNNLKKAAKTNDIEQLQHQAHKLHGACCYTGVPRLKELIQKLESEIKTKPQDQLTPLLNQIDTEINNILKAIKNR